jgi:hypothetical protein
MTLNKDTFNNDMPNNEDELKDNTRNNEDELKDNTRNNEDELKDLALQYNALLNKIESIELQFKSYPASLRNSRSFIAHQFPKPPQ